MKSYYRLLTVIPILVILGISVINADTTYFRELVNKPNATYFDAYRTISVLRTGQNDSKATFDGLKDSLTKDKIIPKSWNKKKAEGFIDRGEMAYMLFQTLKMEGGLTVRIFGVSCRYAFRECVDKGLMASGYADQTLSGEELINILDQAGKYQDKMASKNIKKPAEKKVDKQSNKAEPKKEEPKTPTGGQK
jgi:hypothetical protein